MPVSSHVTSYMILLLGGAVCLLDFVDRLQRLVIHILVLSFPGDRKIAICWRQFRGCYCSCCRIGGSSSTSRKVVVAAIEIVVVVVVIVVVVVVVAEEVVVVVAAVVAMVVVALRVVGEGS